VGLLISVENLKNAVKVWRMHAVFFVAKIFAYLPSGLNVSYDQFH
jgi:hypothetical protein